jgi:hypothetical protein
MVMAEDFFSEGRARWLAAIEQAFGPAPSSREVAGSPETVLRTLQPFLGHGVSHAHFSSGGGHDMIAADLGVEPGTIDLMPGGKIAYRVKPARLAFHYIDAAPEESFLYLDLASLTPSGVYTGPHGDIEEVIDLGGGNYINRNVWDQGFLKHDGDGNEVPFPSGAHIAIRVLNGSILFVQHGSIWNQNAGTYDGRLQSMGEGAILDAIKGAIRRA